MNETDICLKGGQLALNNAYRKSYEEKLSIYERILKECPDVSIDVEKDYHIMKIKNVLFNKKDTATGEPCEDAIQDGLDGIMSGPVPHFSKPYKDFEPFLCKSSCLPELDPLYREYSKSRFCKEGNDKYNTCYPFDSLSNPLASCGKKDFVDPGVKSSSDATTFTSHIALFSLIMCIIFTLFK